MLLFMLNLFILPIKRWLDFSGCSSRKECWIFVITLVVASIVLSFVVGFLLVLATSISTLLVLIIAYSFIIPHKILTSIILLSLPGTGGLTVLILTFIKGKDGRNDYRKNPYLL